MLSLSQQPSVMNAPLFSQPPPGIGGIGIPPISTAGAGQIPPHMMHQQQQQFSGQQAIYRVCIVFFLYIFPTPIVNKFKIF